MNIAMAIRDCRLKRHMTQTKLAEVAGMTVTTVCFYESYRMEPSLRAVKKLADAFGIHPHDLIAEAEKYPD